MMGKQRGTTLAAALAVAAITALPCYDTASAQTAAVPGTATTTTGTGGAEPDLAYGAYQRGHFLTAFGLATHRAAAGDMKAMTLLGELYANGLGVPQNDAKADEWYRLAAARGDREAMFALAMFRLRGRAGARDRDAAAKWFAAAAKLGQPLAAYNLALLYAALGDEKQALQHRLLHERYRPDDNATDRAITLERMLELSQQMA